MFANFKQIFNPANKDLRKRIYFVFFALFVFKLGTTIVVPGIDKSSLGTSNLGILELMNIMGGGALEQFSIFALGVTPYITASIIIQLLSMDIIPYLTELTKQGGTGRAKINQITRYTGIALAFIQGYMFSFAFVSNGTAAEYLTFALFLFTSKFCTIVNPLLNIQYISIATGIVIEVTPIITTIILDIIFICFSCSGLGVAPLFNLNEKYVVNTTSMINIIYKKLPDCIAFIGVVPRWKPINVPSNIAGNLFMAS